MNDELFWEFTDAEWPFTFTDHDRWIVRAIVFDEEGYFYFVRVLRDDHFGKATLIETSGGGVEAGEDLLSAIRRELKEELGADVDVLMKIGVVSDYYNLIHRHNINNYYLCKVRAFGEKHLMPDEIEKFHLSTLKLRYEDAVREYETRTDSRLGRLIAQRELPVLRRAKALLDGLDRDLCDRQHAANKPDQTRGGTPMNSDSFFQNTDCKYFPCHKTEHPENFNCLFCYCPLYMLGSRCGGNFTYTESGIKNCTDCLVPHSPNAVQYVIKRWPDIAEVAKRNSQPGE